MGQLSVVTTEKICESLNAIFDSRRSAFGTSYKRYILAQLFESNRWNYLQPGTVLDLSTSSSETCKIAISTSWNANGRYI